MKYRSGEDVMVGDKVYACNYYYVAHLREEDSNIKVKTERGEELFPWYRVSLVDFVSRSDGKIPEKVYRGLTNTEDLLL